MEAPTRSFRGILDNQLRNGDGVTTFLSNLHKRGL
jgi:hypothetical protein